MYDRILLPLDGSELAEGVEPHAMAMDSDFFAGLSEEEREALWNWLARRLLMSRRDRPPGRGGCQRGAAGLLAPLLAPAEIIDVTKERS